MFWPRPVASPKARTVAYPDNIDVEDTVSAPLRGGLFDGSFEAPHAGEPPVRETPHSRQNFASGRLSAPQLEQFTSALARSANA